MTYDKIPSNYSYSLANSTTFNTELTNGNNEHEGNEKNNKNGDRQKSKNDSTDINAIKLKKSSKSRKKFLHNNKSNNKIPELGKQIFSIYFSDLNLDFFRKHGGGGNGIELLLKNLTITGSDSKNRKKSGLKKKSQLSRIYLNSPSFNH